MMQHAKRETGSIFKGMFTNINFGERSVPVGCFKFNSVSPWKKLNKINAAKIEPGHFRKLKGSGFSNFEVNFQRRQISGKGNWLKFSDGFQKYQFRACLMIPLLPSSICLSLAASSLSNLLF